MEENNELNESKIKKVSRGKKSKFFIKDKKKFIKFVGAIAIIFVLLVVIISSGNKKITIDENTNITELKTKKYSQQIKEYYDKEGMESKFTEEYNDLVSDLLTYVYNNVTGSKTDVDVMNEVNEILKTDDWSSLSVEKPKTWKGTYYFDTSINSLKFKFETKDIEPNWIDSSNVSNVIEKN